MKVEINKEIDIKSFKPISENELMELVDKWQKKLKVKVNRVQLKKMKNKWSSCSSKGNITLNNIISLLPGEIAEYIIAHELLHLIVPNHSKTFNVLLSMYLPNWEKYHRQLILHFSPLLESC